MMKMRNASLVAIAFATLAVAAAACGGKKSSGPSNTLSPATKPNGSPSALACVGSNDHPATTNSNVTITINTVSQTVSGLPPISDVRVAEYDIASGTTTGNVVVTSNATAQMTVKDSIIDAFVATHDPTGSDTFLPTYQFNELTPTAGSSGTFNLRIVPNSTFTALIGLAGVSATLQPSTTYQVAATVVDCDGDPVANAIVDSVPRCAAASGTFPCVVYFAGSAAPSPSKTATDAGGTFAVLGVPPGAYSISLHAVATAGAQQAEIARLHTNAPGGSVALATQAPLSSTP